MSRSVQVNLYKVFLVFLGLVVGIAGFSAALRPVAAQEGTQTVNWNNCNMLYAVQTGDDLAAIAQRFNTTEENLLATNPFLGQMNQGGTGQQGDTGQQGTAQTTPQATDQATPQATDQATPQATDQATAQATPQATDQATPQATDQAQGQAADNIFPGLILCIGGTQAGTGTLPQTGGDQGQQGQQGQTGQQGQQGQTGQQGQQGTTINRGNVGVFSPFGLNENAITVERISPSQYRGGPVNFLMPLVSIEADQTIPTAMTYVFFNLENRHLQAGDDVSIWYRTQGGTWQRCGTSFVVSQGAGQGTSQDAGDQDTAGGSTRGNQIACVAPLYNTVYGVGVAR